MFLFQILYFWTRSGLFLFALSAPLSILAITLSHCLAIPGLSQHIRLTYSKPIMADESLTATSPPTLTARDVEILVQALRNTKSGGDIEVHCTLIIIIGMFLMLYTGRL